MKEHKCGKCGKTKADGAVFTINRSKKDGLQSFCQECQNKAVKIKHDRKYNKHIIPACSVPCKKCGERFPVACMDFHHRNPNEKERSVGQMMSFSDARIEAEIAKCDVYCANCHREIEHKDKPRAVFKSKLQQRNFDIIYEAHKHVCMDCGKVFPTYVMDLHHRDPATKRFTFRAVGNYSERVVRDEIAKCDVLCANCHRIRHNQRKD